jgi:hypothetical protein
MAGDRSFLATVVVALKMVALEKIALEMVAPGIMALIIAAALATPAVMAATQSLSELQERFDREDNAVHKAKLMQKLGDAQFEALHAAEKTEDYNRVGVTLEKYRDNVRVALAGLKKEHPDAERKSNGYRQLQMHLRRGIREVEEALLAAPEEFKPPLVLVRTDLIALDDELLRLLFPGHLETKPPALSQASRIQRMQSYEEFTVDASRKIAWRGGAGVATHARATREATSAEGLFICAGSRQDPRRGND